MVLGIGSSGPIWAPMAVRPTTRFPGFVFAPIIQSQKNNYEMILRTIIKNIWTLGVYFFKSIVFGVKIDLTVRIEIILWDKNIRKDLDIHDVVSPYFPCADRPCRGVPLINNEYFSSF